MLLNEVMSQAVRLNTCVIGSCAFTVSRAPGNPGGYWRWAVGTKYVTIKRTFDPISGGLGSKHEFQMGDVR